MPDGDVNKPFRLGTWLVQPGLNRLSDSDQIVRVEPRVMGVLVCLATRPGKTLSANELLDTIWHGRAHTDDTIYQAIAHLRKALGDDSHQPRYIETIPKKGYRLLAPVVFPEDDQTGKRTVVPPRLAFISAIGIAALIAVGVYVLWQQQEVTVSQPHAAAQQTDSKSIAVLPFVDMSDDQDQKYLADGMAEELIHALSNVPGLRVAARTSAFRFAEKDADIPTIGDQLNVATVLEGSVRKTGDQVRITAQLVNVADGYHLWSKSFDRDSQDLMAIQQEISLAVAEIFQPAALSENLVTALEAPTPSIDAYDYYLLGREHMRHREIPGIKQSISYFEQAIAIDPDFARAYAGLAMAYDHLNQYSGLAPGELLAKSRTAAEQALAIDDREPEAYAALGLVLIDQNDYAGADVALQRAIELNPNYALAYRWYAGVLTHTEREDEVLQTQEKALRLDPLSAHIHMNLGWTHINRGEVETGLQYWRKGIEVDPKWWAVYLQLANYLVIEGRPDMAVLEMKKYIDQRENNEIHPQAYNMLIRCYLELNDFDTAEYWLARRDKSIPQAARLGDTYTALLVARRDYEKAGLELHNWVTDVLDQPRSLNHIALYEMIIGHDGHALRLYEQIETMPRDRYTEGESNLFITSMFRIGNMPAVNAAHLYRKDGNAARAWELLNDSRAFVIEWLDHPTYTHDWSGSTVAGGYHVLASIHALEGDRDQALQELRQAIDAGWRRGWYTALDPNFASLHDDPEFKQILADLKARVATMRERLRLAEVEEKQGLLSGN